MLETSHKMFFRVCAFCLLYLNLNIQNNIYSQNVTSFTLVNSTTDQDKQALTNGTVLNNPGKINIRANTTTNTSVTFYLTGTQVRTHTEGVAPYALFGDDAHGNYWDWIPAIGSYTLRAGTLTISFSVQGTPVPPPCGGTAAIAERAYTTAASTYHSFSFNYNGPVTIRISDVVGRLIEVKQGNGAIRFGGRYPQGTYFAEVFKGDKREVIKLLKL